MSDPDEIERFRERIIEGEKWVKDRPNILAPEYLAQIEEALGRGVVFGLHSYYKGGRGPSGWAALDFGQFQNSISHSRPGDWYTLWSAEDLVKKNLVLAHVRASSEEESGSLIVSPEMLTEIENYLGKVYSELITVYIAWETRGVECDFYDIDGYDEFIERLTNYSHPKCEVYVFPLTLIDKPEYHLVNAKYPNAKGEVPKGGAY